MLNSMSIIEKNKLNALNRIRKLIDEDQELWNEMCTDEENLMKFLYSKNLNVYQTYNTMKNFVKFIKDNPVIFNNLYIQASDVKCALENSLPELLPQRDRKCRRIIIFHANNWDCSTFNFNSIFRAFLLCLDHALQDMHTQNNGFVMIVNWEQFKFNKSKHLSILQINNVIYCLQYCFPVKILELHFIAPSWYVSALFAMLKLNLCEDLRDNFFVHGRNLSTLHEHIHGDVLPTELGGSKPSYDSSKLIRDMEISGRSSIFG